MSDQKEFLFIGGVHDGKFREVQFLKQHIARKVEAEFEGGCFMIEQRYNVKHLTDGKRDWHIYLLEGINCECVIERVKTLLGIND